MTTPMETKFESFKRWIFRNYKIDLGNERKMLTLILEKWEEFSNEYKAS